MSRLANRMRAPRKDRGPSRRRDDAGAASPTAWQDVVRRRVIMASCAFAVWIVSIEAKLIHLQVVQHAELVERAGNQQRRTIAVHSKRGEILDRKGRVLAYSVDADTVYAVPSEIDDPAATARALCDALDDCSATTREALERRLGRRRPFVLLKADPSSAEVRRVEALGLKGVGIDGDTGAVYAAPAGIDDENLAAMASAICDALDDCTPALRESLEHRFRRRSAFVYVRRKVSPAEARRVAALGLDGVGFLTEDRRYYPNRELAAHLVGYVGMDNQGLSGIESTYDSEIAGNAGQTLIHTDARHRPFSRIDRPPTAGATIELTIDKHLQYIVERELRAGVRANDADAGAVVVLDPRNGEVLALASEPSFNPNAFAAATPAQRRNRAVQDIYEPGSTFKIVTAAAALEEGVVERDEVFDVSAGYIRIGRDRIPDFRTYGPLTFNDVIVKSSNVGAILVGLRLGPERLSRYVDRFGFGRAQAPDFPVGESRHSLERGQPQRARHRLHLDGVPGLGHPAADGDRDRRGRQRRGAAAAARRPRRGRRRRARGLGAAGHPARNLARDGGATDRDHDGGRRARHGAPRSRDRLPGRRKDRYGGEAHRRTLFALGPQRLVRRLRACRCPAARRTGHDRHAAHRRDQRRPAARLYRRPRRRADLQRIAEAALRYLKVPRSTAARRPVLVGRSPSAERARLRPAALAEPAAAPRAADVAAVAGRDGAMPDLRGLSVRQATRALARLGLSGEFVGDGTVARHAPPAGEAVDPGASATIWLHRYSPPAGAAGAMGP